MTAHFMSDEEKEFLKHYDITRFDRPSIATDVAVFSIMGKHGMTDIEQVRNEENYRKLPEKKLKILLIKRAGYPFKNHWALPGGFCQKNEDVYETARRELYEETHVSDAYVNLCGIYGDVGRDPRGWIVSHTFLALMDGEKCDLRVGSDAWEARWFDVELEKKEIRRTVKETHAWIENEYHLFLKNTDIGATNIEASDAAEEMVSLSAVVREKRECRNYHETTRYEVVENHGFAFDHGKIITCALLSLRREAESDGRIVFDLMPDVFTLTELQRAFEIIQDKKLLVANFRRKIAPYVVETEQMMEGAGHRPAKFFKRNLEQFFAGK